MPPAQVFLTPTHLAVVTEYARDGDLRALLAKGRRLSEGKARFLLQQLVSAVAYCHCEVSCAQQTISTSDLAGCLSLPGRRLSPLGNHECVRLRLAAC